MMLPDKQDLEEKLRRLTPEIENVRKAGSNLGLSVGVIHSGKIVYKQHFGQKETSQADPPDDNTIYYVSSLTKAITTAAVGILCEKGLMDWDTPVARYVPEFGERNDEIGRRATLTDFLSHRTGLTKSTALWAQRRQRFMMPKSETVKTVVHLRSAAPFRQLFVYNNWGYGLVEAAIERPTGMSYAEYVSQHILKPLDLQRTTIGAPDGSNVTSANTNYDDGTICPLKLPPQSDQTGLAGAGALKGSLVDLLRLYSELLSSYQSVSFEKNSHSSQSPFRQVQQLFDPKMAIGDADLDRHAYTMGFVRSRLPRRLGTTSMNAVYLGADNMPLIGTEAPGVLVYHHHGSLLGTSASVHLIPEMESVILVLSNTFGFTDTADWVGQFLVQALIGESPHDYIEWSERATAAHFGQYADLMQRLERGRTEEAPSQDLRTYCGRYINQAGNFVLEITLGGGSCGLKMRVQDFPDVVYDLLPYDGDTFYWPCNREKEMCEEMMFPWMWEGIHKITFGDAVGGAVTSLSWGLDPLVGAEVFYREL